MIPWFERPVIYDVRARPHLVESTSGSRDLQMVSETFTFFCFIFIFTFILFFQIYFLFLLGAATNLLLLICTIFLMPW